MATFTKRIDADIRDLDHEFYSGSWSVSLDTAWNIGNPGVVTRSIGLRFTGVTIPQGAEITSAKITFRGDGTKTSTGMNIRIIGVGEDNTAEFVLSPENSARTRGKTSAYVNWSGSIAQTEASNLDTPDIKTIVQELVNRVGWASGNAMAFFVYENGSTSGQCLSVDEYGDGSTYGALLTIEYVPSVDTDSSRSAKITGSLGANAERGAVITSAGARDFRSAKTSGKILTNDARGAKATGSNRGNYGIKITKPGYDVKTETDIKNMIFTSARGVLGLRYIKEYTATTDANGDINTAFDHDIGYAPIVIVQVETYDEKLIIVNPTTWKSVFLELPARDEVEVTEVFNFSFSDADFTMNIHAEAYNRTTFSGYDLVGRSYTYRVFYYFNETTDE